MPWQRKCGVRIGKAVSSFSLLILMAYVGMASDYGKLADELSNETARTIAKQVVADPDCPSEAWDLAQSILDSQSPNSYQIAALRSALRSLANQENLRAILADTHARAVAKQIKQNPAYRDAGVKADANWIEKAFERLKKIRLNEEPKIRAPQVELPGLQGLMLIVWILLGAGVLFLLIWAARHFTWKRSLARKAKAMLEEDEPERTVDEWLELAESLFASGRHREAVRCLYLACLLRFDEFGVARFDRSQTNWEHLSRIQVSSRMPEGLRFDQPTQWFDLIWYGNRAAKPEDVLQFKRWYEEVLSSLKENPS